MSDAITIKPHPELHHNVTINISTEECKPSNPSDWTDALSHLRADTTTARKGESRQLFPVDENDDNSRPESPWPVLEPVGAKNCNPYIVTDAAGSRASMTSVATPTQSGIWTADMFKPAQPMYPQGPYQTVTWSKADDSITVSKQPPGTATTVLTDTEWTEDPTPCVCPKCNHSVLSKVYFTTGTCTYIACVGLCLMGCDLGCCLIPFFIDSCKDGMHSCPKCRTHLGTYKRWC